MNDRMFALRQRRGELLAKIDVQRGQLAGIASSWKGQLAIADQGLAVVRFFRAHPLLIAGLSVFVVVRRRGGAGLISSALMILRSYRFLTGFLQKH
ncbi:MAG: YqjK-like family protein [Gammaproteobacteria bacterium]|nr:YqjK-like family protein [Gammaproteobacteria bacterium]MBU1480242.1 YqjK-like family protein [Gammaproteobacteria bacterium]